MAARARSDNRQYTYRSASTGRHQTSGDGGLFSFGSIPYIVGIPTILYFFVSLAYPAFMLLPIAIFGLWIWGSHRSETSLGVSMAAWSVLYVVKMYTHLLPFHYGLIIDFSSSAPWQSLCSGPTYSL